MTRLPQHWVSAPLMDLVELHDARRIPLNRTQRASRRGPYPYYGANGQVDSIDEYLFDGDFILVAEDGGHFDDPTKAVAYEVSGRFWVNNHAHILSAQADIPRRFLTYALNLVDWMQYVGGTTRLKLTQAGMRKINIPLPPLPEQERIVAKLESLSSRSSRAREELSHIPGLITHFKQAILDAAMSGDLTRKWRSQHGSAFDWPIVTLSELADEFSYGSSKKSLKEGDVPVLRMGNIQDGNLDWSKLVFTSDQSEIEKYRLREGDVLFNRTNSPELVGKTAMFKGEREAIYAGYLIRVRCGDRLLPEFLTQCLNSPLGRKFCWEVKSDSVSQSNINAKKLKSFSFPLPDITEQKEIVRQVSRAFETLNRFGVEYEKATKLLYNLEQSIFAMAFSGEFFPQDPNDEPASILLERLRAERTEISKTKRERIPRATVPSAPRRKAAMTKSRYDDDVKEKPYLANLLRQFGGGARAEDLFKEAELPVVDFYKQLAWEVKAGHIKDDETKLEAA